MVPKAIISGPHFQAAWNGKFDLAQNARVLQKSKALAGFWYFLVFI